MRRPQLASFVWLSLSACATAPVERRPPDPFPARPQPEPRESRADRRARGTPPLAPTAAQASDGLARLLLDGPIEGCERFSVVARDRAATRFLVVRVDADELKLREGEHELAIDGRFVAAGYHVFAAATRVAPCDQVREQPQRLQRWRATAGTVKLSWSDEPKRGTAFALDVELVDVELVEEDGRTQAISARLPDVTVGTPPRRARDPRVSALDVRASSRR